VVALISADWLYFLLITVIFVLVFLTPVILAYVKGSKDLGKALNLYSTEIEKALRKYKDVVIKGKGVKTLLELLYNVHLPKINSDIQIEVSLIERRTYVYYLYKIFGKLPDILILRGVIERKPATSLVIIPRKKKKIISKIMEYLSQLQEIRIKSLSQEILFSADDSRYAIKYLSKKVIENVYNLKEKLNFIFVDYTPPHIEINCEITEKTASQVINFAISLMMTLLQNIREVKMPGRRTEALKFIRKTIAELRQQTR